MEYLYILKQALIWVLTTFWCYQFIVSLCALIKLKDKEFITNKNHKFMAIIPAHNEEKVVANLIESLKKQTYDKNLYDIYVIADNCTDKTAKIAKEAGAIVYERFDQAHKTKGYALKWFLKQKIEEKADYDAFFVFDADNIVDKNFITNMNKKLCQGEEVVQGYRDIKNPTDNWITAGYALFYWTMHRFYHLARYNIGLSPLLNGTGFMVKFDVVKPNGWETETLTEDIEFSLKQIIKGARKDGPHPAKRTFQAIRIEVNGELDVLKTAINDMTDLLNPKGRLAIITFHSLEDRIVKNEFRKQENPCTCPREFPVCMCNKVSKGKVITRKPILPSEEELLENHRARSAKLRVFERK